MTFYGVMGGGRGVVVRIIPSEKSYEEMRGSEKPCTILHREGIGWLERTG